MSRRGLTPAAVVDAAVALVEAEGADALQLSQVAKALGVRTPSLYNHVDGLDDLQREVALRATVALGQALGDAVMGRAGRDALLAVAETFRAWAKEHPGLYALTLQARPDDEVFAAAGFRATEPVLAVLRGFDLCDEDSIHAARTLRAALHGFVSLELAGGFGLQTDVEASFRWLIERLVGSLTAAR